MIRVFSIVSALVVCAGCGDNTSGAGDSGPPDAASCKDPADRSSPEGLLTGPDDFEERTSCEPGSLTGFDPTGLWYIEHEEHPRWQRGPVRFSLSCEQGLEVGLSTIADNRPVLHRYLDADDLFFRKEQSFGADFTFTEAYDICKLNDDGSLFGWWSECFSGDFGEFCDETSFTARPFGRIAGEVESDGLELVSEWSGGDTAWPKAFTADVRVRQGIAYIARGEDGVRIVDVSDPDAVRDLGFYPSQSDNYNELKIVEDAAGSPYLLVASEASGILVLDVADPTDPTMVTRFSPMDDPTHGVHTLYTEVVGDKSYAYLADGFTDNVFVFDVTVPAEPENLGTFNLGNQNWGVHAVFVDQGRAYINATLGGLMVVDLLPFPSVAVPLGRYTKSDVYAHQSWTTTAGGRHVALHGDEGYGSHFEVVDIDESSDEFLDRIGELDLRPQVSIHDMMAIGDRAYVAHYQDGVRIIDLSDPTNPSQVAYFNTWNPQTAPGAMLEGAVGLDVDADAGLIYVADTPRGLLILRETD